MSAIYSERAKAQIAEISEKSRILRPIHQQVEGDPRQALSRAWMDCVKDFMCISKICDFSRSEYLADILPQNSTHFAV